MIRVAILATALVSLAACVESGNAPRPAAHVPVPPPVAAPPPPASVAAIKGMTAPRLIAQFGQPRLDMTEGNARKLQFAGPICVLDAYLYPPASGTGEVTVAHIDTRQRDGGPIDPASCVAALSRRPGTR